MKYEDQQYIDNFHNFSSGQRVITIFLGFVVLVYLISAWGSAISCMQIIERFTFRITKLLECFQVAKSFLSCL